MSDSGCNPADAPRQYFELGELALENGAVLRDAFLGCVVHGIPEPDGTNVILVTASIGGDAHRLDCLIGPGRAFDPARHCVIAVDAIGNGWSISPSNSPGQPGMEFPPFTIGDMVKSQHRLLTEHFGLEYVSAVAGASMGGMQALEWGVRHPEMMDSLVTLAPLARTQAWTVAVNQLSRNILFADAAWQNGRFVTHPERALRAWSNLMDVLIGTTPARLDEQVGGPANIVEHMRTHEETTVAGGMAPEDWIYQTRAYDAHNVGRCLPFAGDADAALASIRARTLVMAPAVDLYNPVEQQRAIAEQIPRSQLEQIDGGDGHEASNPVTDAARAEMNDVVGSFLKAADEPACVHGSGQSEDNPNAE